MSDSIYENYYQYCNYYYQWNTYYQKKRRRRCTMTIFFLLAEQFKTRINRKLWMHPWVSRRLEKGLHHNLFMELSLEDPNRFRRCLRMDTATFEELLQHIAPLIRKQDTHLRLSVPPDERLSLTLRHLATGETQDSLSMTFRLGQSTISGIIKEVCRAIAAVLREQYLKFSSSEAEWKVTAREFGDIWNFENCIGAIDGKHIRIEPPIGSGSLYYCYKDYCSIVLMAVADALLRYIYIYRCWHKWLN